MKSKIFGRMCLVCAVATLLMYAALLVARVEFWLQGLVIAVGVIGLCCLASYIAACGVVAGLMQGEEYRGKYQELSPLFKKLEEQKSTIRSTTTDLQEKNISFRLIAESMHEGLILLDSKGLVVMMNKSAAGFLGQEENKLVGKHVFVACEDTLFQAAVEAALGGQSGTELFNINGSSLELVSSPIFVEGVTRGAILLFFDVTEKVAAEQMRREFSANVSHELKTPLTSISGYAELMKDGLVKPDDTSRFATSIYKEAQRLISLVDDIMKLSQLDENSDGLVKKPTPLLPIANSVSERLAGKAESYGVKVYVAGENLSVLGDERILDEMLYNLCDNAIKYNRPDGKVEVMVQQGENGVELSVSDTGIGIPKEHQERIFERFYRVDKSHSKETGGTGLGLSIVKHGAAFHNAEVILKSTPDSGTRITIVFPQSGK